MTTTDEDASQMPNLSEVLKSSEGQKCENKENVVFEARLTVRTISQHQSYQCSLCITPVMVMIAEQLPRSLIGPRQSCLDQSLDALAEEFE